MTTSNSSESADWLVAEHKVEGHPLVMRCPPHITQHCFWITGIPYSRMHRAWIREVRARDALRPVWKSYLSPYSLDPADLAARMLIAKRFKDGATRKAYEAISEGQGR